MEDYGPSPAAVALAVAALFAAALSIWLAAGQVGGSDQRAAGEDSSRSDSENGAARPGTEYERVEGPVRSLAPAGDAAGNDVGSSTAFCPPRTRVMSGGFQTSAGSGGVFYNGALTIGRVGWAVGAVNNLAQSGTLQAFAYCISAGRTGSPAGHRLRRQREAGRREVQALVDRYRVLRASQAGAGGL